MKQTFIVTLEVDGSIEHFPRVEAERMANIIRDGVAAKSCSFLGPVSFDIICQRGDESATASGEMRQYSPEEFEQPDPALGEAAEIYPHNISTN